MAIQYSWSDVCVGMALYRDDVVRVVFGTIDPVDALYPDPAHGPKDGVNAESAALEAGPRLRITPTHGVALSLQAVAQLIENLDKIRDYPKLQRALEALRAAETAKNSRQRGPSEPAGTETSEGLPTSDFS